MDAMLAANSFERWRRCKRGSDQDLVEQLFRNEPFADARYGVGENRYVIDA
jgi:hypothetical protein